MDAEGLFGVEKVEPDSLNLLVNTSVGSIFTGKILAAFGASIFLCAQAEKVDGAIPLPKPAAIHKGGFRV